MILKRFLSLLLILVPTSSADNEKRLLLHSDTDIAQKIGSMEQQIADLTATVAVQKRDLQALKSSAGKGSTYTRWGRTVCPGNGTSLVYSGFVAGTYHDGAKLGFGSGANYLCLADQPTWDHYSATDNNQIRVTGVEYQFSGYINDITAFFGSNIVSNEAPCAVCHSSRTPSLMIPGRTNCYPGWTKEYSGYLVGAYPHYNDATEFVCLDRRPESVVNSGIADGENSLYFVETNCGKALECPPYVHDRELACVVCTA